MEFLSLPSSTIWEPACGDGAIVKVLVSYGHDVIATDIIYGQDYFQQVEAADVIITNPPFNLSQQFIEKAVTEANTVAMLLKSQYWHAAKRKELFKNTKPAFVLPLTWRPDFLQHERQEGEKGSPTMDVAWTVWKKGNNEPCKYIPLHKPNNPKL